MVPGSQLAVSRELELFSCFFFLCACRRHKFLSQRHRHQPSKNHQLSPSDMQTIGLYATLASFFFSGLEIFPVLNYKPPFRLSKNNGYSLILQVLIPPGVHHKYLVT